MANSGGSVSIKDRVAELIKQEDSSSAHQDANNIKEGVLESTKAEMDEVREENERLKKMLKRIENDYQSLQFRFFNIIKQETSKKSSDSAPISHDETTELVSLCLGRTLSEPKKDERSSSSSRTRESAELKASLSLGLNSKFEMSTELASNPSLENSLEEMKEEEAGGETWPPPPSKAPKRNGDDEVAQQGNAKKARVCVRARCDTPTMNDGCHWRKYGQKIAKNNPCPRAYYRCTVAPSCPVRKQVQRCAEDMSILITTYEGTHNHPLPVSATAMAATTSAAASMLLSGSSVSHQASLSSPLTATSTPQLSGLSFNLYDSLRTKQFYLPNTSSSPLFPTITLDLTTSPSTSAPPFNGLFSSSSNLTSSSSRFPSSLSFSSSQSSNVFSTVWGMNNRYHQSTYNAFPYHNNNNDDQANNVGSLNSLGKQHQEQVHQPIMGKIHQGNPQQDLTETLTKAITSDPSLRTVIEAAISSMMGGNANASGGKQLGTGEERSCGENLKLGEPKQNDKGCASSYFKGTSQGAAGLLEPASPFSIFNSASMPSNKEHDN